MFKILFFVLITLAATPTHAESKNIRWKELPNNEIQFWIFHQEKGLYFVDEFKKAPNRFQEKIKSISFKDIDKALEAYEKIKAISSATAPLKLRTDPEFYTEITGSVVWETKYQWNESWEIKFKDWLEANADSNFLKRYGIATDCADVAFAFRWIFSRISGLPAGNHLMGSNQIFTNESMLVGWKYLPTNSLWYRDQRFLAALNYVLNNTYTHSLMGDAYPIAINKNSLNGGSFFLNLYDSETGHTQFIPSVILDPSHPEPIRILASTVPKAVRDLEEYGFQGYGDTPNEGVTGFIRFRWPVKTSSGWALERAERMPNYSLEQFSSDFMNGYDDVAIAAIYRMMPNWSPDYKKALKSRVELLIRRFQSRVKVVTDGYNYCSTHGGCREGSSSWEIWSTPSRDLALENLGINVTDLYWNSSCDVSCKNELSSKLGTVITTVNGRRISLGDAMIIWENEEYSSNPNDSIPARWGIGSK